MKKSNIFAYIELSKLVEELRSAYDSGRLKDKLKSQAAYFNIIEPRYFSDASISEWEAVLDLIRQKGARTDEQGKVVLNAVSNTIDHLSEKECMVLADKVYFVFDKVKKEFQ
ncbi:hypothetical protein DYBT9275_00661 [Dyadobacter sp. CECT 9275]|uniref:Uncharacterized protein n=1 Tax=Dyadobacter helix TaxID=2822344 RepID=A0A916J912_9BACT|nr:hypothetical protein [Dyadobacter sp. CECT 9275]CAG4991025.1 hypothetical protein DYBT9275_00661 [Dyadobacter sp. CECT 9275]